ncbi:MAG TPA: hypothetical protein VNT51_06690 [Miltoncostaeaceae bacterium]|nr:hypothetical protein [Miltoncostaeaceae bacterium]
MRRAELRLESYLAESRGTWVTMAQIKRRCGLSWDEAAHVWRRALPRLVGAGLVDARTRPGGAALQFTPRPAMVRAVADLQWRVLASPVLVGA